MAIFNINGESESIQLPSVPPGVSRTLTNTGDTTIAYGSTGSTTTGTIVPGAKVVITISPLYVSTTGQNGELNDEAGVDSVASWATALVKFDLSGIAYMPMPSGDTTGAKDGFAISQALATGRNTIQFGPGIYYDNQQRFPGNYEKFSGIGGLSGGAAAATLLVYTGTAASYLNWQNSIAAGIQDIMIYCNNPGFLSRVVDLSGVSTLPRLRDSYIGCVDTTTAVVLYMDQCQDISIQGLNVVGGLYGIVGVDGSTSYCNAVEVFGGTRIGGQGAAGACIKGMGAGWDVKASFELQNGQKGIAAGPKISEGGAIHGSLFGDAHGSPTAIEVWADGLEITGNFIGSSSSTVGEGVKFVGTSDGVAIGANTFIDVNIGVDKNSQAATNTSIGPNNYRSYTTKHNFTPQSSPYIEANS